jgi:hypothetical protein
VHENGVGVDTARAKIFNSLIALVCFAKDTPPAFCGVKGEAKTLSLKLLRGGEGQCRKDFIYLDQITGPKLLLCPGEPRQASPRDEVCSPCDENPTVDHTQYPLGLTGALGARLLAGRKSVSLRCPSRRALMIVGHFVDLV